MTNAEKLKEVFGISADECLTWRTCMCTSDPDEDCIKKGRTIYCKKWLEQEYKERSDNNAGSDSRTDDM